MQNNDREVLPPVLDVVFVFLPGVHSRVKQAITILETNDPLDKRTVGDGNLED